jgi:2-oxoglutarate ferredoxin oxidoreductase subunit gamma
MPVTEIRIAGFGGQGVILAGMVIGKAASIFHDGYATLTQSFGPEARGGAASVQVILSDEPVLYPYVTAPDILAVLSQEAYARFAPTLKQDGLLIAEEDLVTFPPAAPRARSIAATRIAEGLGRRMVMNMIVVGFVAGTTTILEPEAFRRAIVDSVPAASRDLNLRAFEVGYSQASMPEADHAQACGR